MSGFQQIMRLFGGKSPAFTAPLAPDSPFVAVGDIHGRADLLDQLLEKLSTVAPDMPCVFVGDYVDRGPDSATVLRRLHALEMDGGGNVICLLGNHEAMLLDAIDSPTESAKLWLGNGGDKTLQSLGIPDDITPEDLPAALKDALGADVLSWLRNRPLLWQNGNVIVCHAGGDPERPLEARRGHALLWGHPRLHTSPRQDGLWVVHGHFIQATPHVQMGRIAIDTGAYKTDRLTAARITREGVDFFTTSSKK